MSALRITSSDAASVVDRAVTHFGWTRADWDEIAGTVIAGRLLTAFTQAEINADGSAVLSDEAGTRGPVTTDTVRARLLAGVRGVELADPDATVRLNTVRLEQEGTGRVLVHSVRGLPAPGMKAPPLQRRTPSTPVREPGDRAVAPTLTTDPETISALLEDLNRRRLMAGAADDDSVHWDSLPLAAVPLGRPATVTSGSGDGFTNVVVGAPTEDAYDWLQWYLSVERFRALVPAETEGFAVERDVLPNLNALNFVVTGLTEADLAGRVRGAMVDVPEALLPDGLLTDY